MPVCCRPLLQWRFYEFLGLRIEDLPKASAVVSDIRKILRQVRGGWTAAERLVVSRWHRRDGGMRPAGPAAA